MAKLLLFSFGDVGSAGIRQLASFLRMHGHVVNIALIEGNQEYRLELDKCSYKESLDIFFNSFSEGEQADSLGLPLICKGTVSRYSRPDSYALPKSFFNYVQDWNPDLVGLSTRLLPGIPFAAWFSQIKETCPKALLMAGGFGPSTHPEIFLDAGADVVCRGEGEYALLDLANCLDTNTRWDDIANFSYKKSTQTIHNPLRPIEKDLDKFPQPLIYAPGIFHSEGENFTEQDPFLTSRVRYVLSGRGCIASCSYCAADTLRALYRNEGLMHPKYRYRSTDFVIEELLQHKKQGCNWIHLCDDFFVRPVEEMREFLDKYREKVHMNFTCNLHPDYLHHYPDILDKADQAGLWSLGVNIQSPAEPLARDIFNRKNDHRVIKELIQLGHTRYMPVTIDFIDGFRIPGMDDLEAKLDFIKQLPPFNAAYPDAISFLISQLVIQPNAMMLQRCPDMYQYLLSRKEYLYRAMLMNFRYILNDEDFVLFRKNKAYRHDPSVLPELFRRVLNERHTMHLRAQAARLEGEEVYFHGSRDSFASRRHLFARVKPVAIIDDEISATEMDGIPVVNSLAILQERPLPVIVFSWRAMQAMRMMKRLLPDMPEEDLVLCLENEFPGQADMAEAMDTIQERNKTIALLHNKLEGQQGKINSMLSSASWKITSPLRTIKRMLKAF